MKLSVNGQDYQIEAVDPNLTLLDWLRDQQQMKGTKEGCASGDCGACTLLLITEDTQGQPEYLAINACITLLVQLHNKSLVTVEYLSRSGQLHPVQQGLVQAHASQCGFCTPGIVMSLYALYLRTPQPNRDQVLDALSGNLCRCTGYRPILESVQHWTPSDLPLPAGLNQKEQPPSEQDDCFWPTSEKDLQQQLKQHPEARLLAGGTDLTLEVTQQLKDLTPLILLNGVQTLQQGSVQEDQLHLGAGLTYSQAEPLLARYFPAFYALMERLASRQIRNQGTLGGNLCNASPIGDTPPVFLALDAQVILASAAGERQLPITDFFTGYKQTALQAGEYLQKIRVPLLKEGQQLQVYKVSKRHEDDISAVLAAFWLDTDGETIHAARLGFGGMAAVPARALKTEQALVGQPLNEATFKQAAACLAEDFSPLSDVRASAGYRLQLAKNLLVKWGQEVSHA